MSYPSKQALAQRWINLLPRIKYQLLNMLKIKSDINPQDFKIVDLHFVQSGHFNSRDKTSNWRLMAGNAVQLLIYWKKFAVSAL